MKIPGKYICLVIVLCGLIFGFHKYDRQKSEAKDDPGIPEKLEPEPLDKEATSTGERVLVHQKPWLNEDGEKQKKCKDNWQQKTELRFNDFLINCPIDVEAKIYANNKIIRTNAETFGTENSIIAKVAIVVSIGGNKKSDLTTENGERVFDSIEKLKGIELAQRDFLNGISVGGKKIFLEVLIVDDSYNDTFKEKDRAERAAKYLIDREDVIAVIGHSSSNSIQAAAKYYDNELVAFSATSTAIRTKKSLSGNVAEFQLNPYIFRTAPNDKFAVEALIDVIKNINRDIQQKPLKTAVILHDNSSIFSSKYKEEFEKQFLKEIEGSQIIPTDKENNCEYSNYDPINTHEYCVNFIKNNNPDLLLLIPSFGRALEIAKPVLEDIDRLQLKPQLLGADTMFNNIFSTEGIAENMIVAVPTKTRTIKGVELSWRGMMTYDAAQAIFQAISETECDLGSQQQDDDSDRCLRKQIQEVLSGKDFKAPGILGSESVFFEDGDRQIDEGMAKELGKPQQVIKTEDGKHKFELYIKGKNN